MLKRCSVYKRLMSRHVDGDLNGLEEDALKEHLKQCPRCRTREHRYTFLREEIKNLHTTTDPSRIRTVPTVPRDKAPRRIAWRRPLGWVTAVAVFFVIGFLLLVRSDPLNGLAEKNPIVYEPMRVLISVMDENGEARQSSAAGIYNPMRHYIARVESDPQINEFFLFEGTVTGIISEQ